MSNWLRRPAGRAPTMRRKPFTEDPIIGILKETAASRKTTELYRRHGIIEQTFYRWMAKYGGLWVNEARRLRPHQSSLGPCLRSLHRRPRPDGGNAKSSSSMVLAAYLSSSSPLSSTNLMDRSSRG